MTFHRIPSSSPVLNSVGQMRWQHRHRAVLAMHLYCYNGTKHKTVHNWCNIAIMYICTSNGCLIRLHNILTSAASINTQHYGCIIKHNECFSWQSAFVLCSSSFFVFCFLSFFALFMFKNDAEMSTYQAPCKQNAIPEHHSQLDKK